MKQVRIIIDNRPQIVIELWGDIPVEGSKSLQEVDRLCHDNPGVDAYEVVARTMRIFEDRGQAVAADFMPALRAVVNPNVNINSPF